MVRTEDMTPAELYAATDDQTQQRLLSEFTSEWLDEDDRERAVEAMIDGDDANIKATIRRHWAEFLDTHAANLAEKRADV